MTQLGNRLIKLMIRFVLWASLRLHIVNQENMPLSGSFIIASNHLGRLDPIIVYNYLDRNDLVMLVAEKYARVAFFRWSVKQLNSLFVDRFNPDIKTLREALNRLKNGSVIVLAPEGTRSKSEALLEARPGVSYLAIKAGVPIVPVAIYGTEDRVVKANLLRLRRSDATVTIGKPFTLPPMNPSDREGAMQSATDEIMCRIAALLPPKYRGFYADHPRTQELIEEK